MNKPLICNFCFLEDLKRFASQLRGELMIDEDQEGGRVTVRINGAEAATFVKMPTSCLCSGIRAVHILLAGRALCGMPGVPKDWPPGHRWVAWGRRGDATCLTCQIIADNPATPPFTCPYCSSSEFLEGPHGGVAINFACAHCGRRFNDMLGWIDDDPEPIGIPERETWKPGYRPRTSTRRNSSV